MTSIEDIRKTITDANAIQTSEIIKKFDEVNKRMDGLEDRIVVVSDDLSTYAEKNDIIMDKLEHRIEYLEDKLARNDRYDQVLIRNIPVTANENVAIIFNKMCVALGCGGFLPAPLVKRFKPSTNADKNTVITMNNSQRPRRAGANYINPSSSSTESVPQQLVDVNVTQIPSILVKFHSNNNKITFMKAYFQHGELDISDVGFLTKDRIIVRENLTQRNHKIFCLAMKLKKDGFIKKVMTVSGLVLVYHNDKDNEIISSITTLENKYLND